MSARWVRGGGNLQPDGTQGFQGTTWIYVAAVVLVLILIGVAYLLRGPRSRR